MLGTKEGQWVSMAVISNGEYGAASDVIFSFPVTCKNGEWTIVKGLTLSEFAKKKLQATSEELLAEKKMALGK